MSWNIRSTFSNQEVPTFRPQWNADTFKNTYEAPGNASVTPISCLSPGILRPRVAGVIIHKGDQKSFMSKKDSTEKCVLDLTIRDSAQDFITVSCWGHFEFINDIDKNHQIGCAVRIENLVVQSKPLDGTCEKFKPTTPGMYFLSLFETQGVITRCEGDGLQDLMHIPIKAPNDYYTIFEINSNRHDLEGHLISILSIVKEVGPVREFKGKLGRQCRRCEVTLFDDTASELILTIWNEACIQQSQQWKAKETVIFGADLKVYYNTYKNKVTVSSTSKTILTDDPDSREAFLLSRYARTVDFNCPTVDDQSDAILDDAALDQVTERRSVKEVKAYMEESEEEIFCVVWAHLTSFPIDQDDAHRCLQCHKALPDNVTTCACSKDPPNQARVEKYSPFYNIKASLSDSTGTLKLCVLPSCVIEKMLDMKVEDFYDLDQTTKTSLKWKYLMEMCKVVIQVCNSSERQRKVRILSVSLLYTDANFIKAMAQI